MKRLALAFAAACALLLSVVVDGAAGSGSTVGVTAAPRTPAGARAVRSLPAGVQQSATVVLRPRDEQALQQFIASVSSPSSPMFRHYLAPGQYRSRFGPMRATIDAVSVRLRAAGLRVTNVASDGLFLTVRGSTARFERAFGTGLERFRLADGTIAQATTGAVRLPASIAGSVAAVVGLNSLVRERPAQVIFGPKSRGSHPAAKAPSFSHPPDSPKGCAAARKTAEQSGGLTDDKIAHAYGAFGLYRAGDLGAGEHVAIYELEPFLRSDVKAFDTCYFGASAAAQMAKRLSVFPVDGGQKTGAGSGEATLDIEDISAMAPGAHIDVYEGQSPDANGITYDPIDPYVPMVDKDVDKVISTSWGLCEQAVQAGQPGLQAAENLLFEQAAAQGQSIFSAQGDNGDDDCNTNETTTPVSGQNPLSVDDPSSQPDVVGVGGTTIDDATQPAQERVWNDGATWGGGGGGISMSWEMPAWQLESKVPGIVLPGSADYAQADKVEKAFGYRKNFCQAYLAGATASTPCENKPDVSAQADEFTGAVTIYYAGQWSTIGGTSSAAPIWAAMLTLVNASAACQSNSATKSGVGFVNPLLYAVASSPAAYRASFNDIKVGNNDIYDIDDGRVFPTTTGYDLASGLGSPMVTAPGGRAGLAYYLCTYATSATRPAVNGLSPSQLPIAGGHVTITGSGFESGGHPDVTGVRVGTWSVPRADFTTRSNTRITATFPRASKTVPARAPRPQDGAGPADVIVTAADGESSAPGSASTLQYVNGKRSSPVPSVTGVVGYGGSESSPARVTILGSRFTRATRVTFGGQAARTFKVVNADTISVKPPAYSKSSTRCSPLPKSGVYKGENATNDICQVQVQVAGAHGSSRKGTIRPPYQGAISTNSLGDLVAPANCGCEIAQGTTEYDYVPAPSISSVSTSVARPASLASEAGGTVITITGRGFDPLTIEWVNIGSPALELSEDVSYAYMTGKQIQIVAPAQKKTVDPRSMPLSVRSVAGLSSGSSVVYAGVPKVSEAVNTSLGRNGAADSGGSPVSIHGQGFRQAVGPLLFYDVSRIQPPIYTTQYTYSVASDRSITTQSPPSNPGLDNVEVCSVTACSLNPPADYFYLFPPGNPKVGSVSPASGPVGGGTSVRIHGQNLGCVTGVYFGSAVAERFSTSKAVLDCGSTDLLDATAPPGRAGSRVPVTVTTVESDFTGSGRSASRGYFTYR